MIEEEKPEEQPEQQAEEEDDEEVEVPDEEPSDPKDNEADADNADDGAPVSSEKQRLKLIQSRRKQLLNEIRDEQNAKIQAAQVLAPALLALLLD